MKPYLDRRKVTSKAPKCLKNTGSTHRRECEIWIMVHARCSFGGGAKCRRKAATYVTGNFMLPKDPRHGFQRLLMCFVISLVRQAF